MKEKVKAGWMQAVPQIKVGKTVISPMKSKLSQSEKDFLAGQKAKEDYMKKNPGKAYPNTAN